MDKSYSVIVTLNEIDTTFIITDGNKTIFSGASPICWKHIINDVKQCLRISEDEAKRLTASKGSCLSTVEGTMLINAINVPTRVLSEIIEARVCALFTSIKETLKNEPLYRYVSSCQLNKNKYYIDGMEEVLERIMEKPATILLNTTEH